MSICHIIHGAPKAKLCSNVFFLQQCKNWSGTTLIEKEKKNKSKIRRTCENYARIKTPYKYENIIGNLSNNKNIIISKQDKGRGVVILNRKSYIGKCCKILETGQLRKREIDPTKTIKGKLKRMLRSIKNMFTEREHKQLYPAGSKPGAFYGNAKVHKLRKGEGLKELILRPIVSNDGTYNTAKYLAKQHITQQSI